LPSAIEPLWQDAQVPDTCVWSTRSTGDQPAGVWQASHTSLVGMWFAVFPVARLPL
jgi:hypothetical protein